MQVSLHNARRDPDDGIFTSCVFAPCLQLLAGLGDSIQLFLNDTAMGEFVNFLENSLKNEHSIDMTKKLWEPKDVEFVFSSYEGFEERLLKFLKVIPFDEANDHAWSPDLVSLFIDVCATIDSVSRRIIANGEKENDEIEIKDTDGKTSKRRVRDLNIDDYESSLWGIMDLKNSWSVVYLYILYPDCAINPYSDHRDPDGWWTTYNALKHNRLDNYQQATINNVVVSLSALFLLLVRYKDEEFTRALIRRHWVVTSTVPEFVHGERTKLWYDSKLFGTHDIPGNISSRDITKIPGYLGSQKFHEFLGRFNPLPPEVEPKTVEKT
jgi:hypothetical protein